MAPRSIFADRHKFQDDVWGQILLNDIERDVIDTPEFQRLLRTSQMGFVDLVYHTANHTRGAHSIGACYVADMLMDRLHINIERDSDTSIRISPAERVLIRLGALLHDITHLPLSHDIEKKNHRIFYDTRAGDSKEIKMSSFYGYYDKHDNYMSNPLLYVMLCDNNKSVLARTLTRHSPTFYDLLIKNTQYAHLQEFLAELRSINATTWDVSSFLLPSLLFHLLFYEDPSEADHFEHDIAVDINKGHPVITTWGLGPSSLRRTLHQTWYQPFRHDIIGNTLSADLIDYLRRDPKRLSMDRHIDLHLLNYYTIVSLQTAPQKNVSTDGGKTLSKYRCAINLRDTKRGTARIVLLNDIFRLLDLRHEIHEKAVVHRVVLAANAMLSRAMLLMGHDQRPSLYEILKIDDDYHALQGEDVFFHQLLSRCGITHNTVAKKHLREAREILLKIVDRRVYRPLMIIPGDRAAAHFGSGDGNTTAEYKLRTLAALVDSSYYSTFLLFVSWCVEKLLQNIITSDIDLCAHIKNFIDKAETVYGNCDKMRVIPSKVIIWTTPYKQLYKDPGVVVRLGGWIGRVDEIPDKLVSRGSDNITVVTKTRKAIEEADMKYAAMWKLYVFISDGLFYSGTIDKIRALSKGAFDSTQAVADHQARLNTAKLLCVTALDAASRNWFEYCESEDESHNRQQKLASMMTDEQLARIVARWISAYLDGRPANGYRPSELSTLNTEDYVHGDPTCPQTGANCRDVRYKVDKPATEAWANAKLQVGSPECDVVLFLERMGVQDPAKLSERQFLRLVADVGEKSLRACRVALRNEVSSESSAPTLNVLWEEDCSWLIEPAHLDDLTSAAETSRSHGKTADTVLEQKLPTSAVEIESYILEATRTMPQHVAKQVSSNARLIAELIAAFEPSRRSAVIRDLETRIMNESRLMWNNIKVDQVLQSLGLRSQGPPT